jgi:hypothetical protein
MISQRKRRVSRLNTYESGIQYTGITTEDRQAYYEGQLMRLARLVLFHRQLLEEIKNTPDWKPAPKPQPSEDDDAPLQISPGIEDFNNIYRSAQRSLLLFFQQAKKDKAQIKSWLEDMTIDALKDINTEVTPSQPVSKLNEKKLSKTTVSAKSSSESKHQTKSTVTTDKGKASKNERLTRFSDEYHKALLGVVISEKTV